MTLSWIFVDFILDNCMVLVSVNCVLELVSVRTRKVPNFVRFANFYTIELRKESDILMSIFPFRERHHFARNENMYRKNMQADHNLNGL